MKYDLSFVMSAMDMFENNDLLSEIEYALQTRLEDGEIDFSRISGLTDDEIDRLYNAYAEDLRPFISYKDSDLAADYADRDGGELYIFYVIPIDIDVYGFLGR